MEIYYINTNPIRSDIFTSLLLNHHEQPTKSRKFENIMTKNQKKEQNNLTFQLIFKSKRVIFKPVVWGCSQLVTVNKSKKNKLVVPT